MIRWVDRGCLHFLNFRLPLVLLRMGYLDRGLRDPKGLDLHHLHYLFLVEMALLYLTLGRYVQSEFEIRSMGVVANARVRG